MNLIGSSSFMLFSENSDVDLCVDTSSILTSHEKSTQKFSVQVLQRVMEPFKVMFPGSSLESQPSVPCILLQS